MTSMKDNGGFAFPVHPNATAMQNAGMSLRDYFAAKAMQGFASLESTNDYLKKDLENGYKSIAISAYCLADAMLEAREK